MDGVERLFMNDCAVQTLKEAHVEGYDVLKHLFRRHYDEDICARAVEAASGHLLDFQEFLHGHCRPLVRQDRTACEENFFHLFDSLVRHHFEEVDEWRDNKELWPKLGLLCSIWAVFSGINKEDQAKVDGYMREIGVDIPVYGTVFDYFLDFESGTWEHFERKVKEWSYRPDEPSNNIFIETKDYAKYAYFIKILSQVQRNVLLIGT